MRTFCLITLLILGACGKQRPSNTDDGHDDDTASTVPGDDDGDGYAESGGDCDDNDPNVHPNAGERCNGEDDDCDDVVDEDASDATGWYADADSDGWGDNSTLELHCGAPGGGPVDAGNDCDDTDSAINPGATEVCDGVDNNCDGEVDGSLATDATSWYHDEDGDGYGESEEAQRACTQPAGYVEARGDCDDDDADTHPGADEYCDGVDTDCNGNPDDDDALDAVTWHFDGDSDGFGDPDFSQTSCEAPIGYADNGDDCDDTDGDINPDADERCDSVDNDCDGSADENDAVDASTWYVDGDGDGYGSTDGTIDSCTRPAGYARSSTDCDDGDSSTWPGASEVCGDGVVNDCNSTVADAQAECGLIGAFDVGTATALFTGVASANYAGSVVAGVGDVNDDGADDLLIGAYQNSTNGTLAGAAYLVLGGATGQVGLGSADAILMGEVSRDYAGSAIGAAGDVNNDGYADLIIGAPENDNAGRTAGAAYLVLGPVTGSVDLGDADAILTGEDTYEAAGRAVAGGLDIDGDGYGEVLVGADGNDRGGSAAGAAYLWLGDSPPSGGDLGDAEAIFYGEGANDNAGAVLASGGDVNDDGVNDILISALSDDTNGSGSGAVYLILGTSALSGNIALADADAKLAGEAAGDEAGTSIALDGDLNDDGYADVIVGAPQESTTASGSGAAYVVYGPISGTIDLSTADAKLLGSTSADYAGQSVAYAGDADGDGIDDLMVGAHYADGASSRTGVVYMMAGPVSSGTLDLSSADGQIDGLSAYDYAGCAVDGLGDFSGNGDISLAVGAFGNDLGGSSAGAVYVLSGQSY